jgi:hypothetical protein
VTDSDIRPYFVALESREPWHYNSIIAAWRER